jgi:heptosyltransferase III
MKLLIFHTGSLGDTLAAVPALWAIREHFRNTRVTLLTDRQGKGSFVGAQEVLAGSGLIDDWITYPMDASLRGKIFAMPALISAVREVRHRRYDGLVYLIQNRQGRARKRDMFVFRLAGIRKFYGACGSEFPAPGDVGHPLPRLPHQSDHFLGRLSLSGILVQPEGQGRVDIGISDWERSSVEKWRKSIPDSGDRIWVAIGPGSKMPAKRWPTERFREVVSRLIDRYDIWPVVFGGSEDRNLDLELIKTWGRGSVAAGELGIRQGVAALERCVFYLGNDTGTMHMAVSAGIPCVAVFSARDYPGLWCPYGQGHLVIRRNVECEGCMLTACTKNAMKCLLDISVDEIYKAAESMLLSRRPCAV